MRASLLAAVLWAVALFSVGCRPTPTGEVAQAWSTPSGLEPGAEARPEPEPEAGAATPSGAASYPTTLVVPLDGPFDGLAEPLAKRLAPVDADCGDGEARAEIRETVTLAPGFDTPVLEAQRLRIPGSLACAPIEYCVLAVRTVSGWWLSPPDENDWCSGITGTGVSVATEEEDLWLDERQPARLVVSGIEVETRLEAHGRPGGNADLREHVSRDPWAMACEVTGDGRPWCQVLPDPPFLP